MQGYTLGHEWKRGERTFHAFTRQVQEDDGAVAYVPAVQTVIRDAAGPVVEASREHFSAPGAALSRAKVLLQKYFGLDPSL